MSNNVVEINAENWDSEVMQSKVPVIVDFWAEWCNPCKMLSPIMDKVAEEMNGKIKVAKVNCETNMDLAKSNSVRSIPAVFLIRDGKIEKKTVGAMSKDSLLKFIGDV
jgi:thioredoxin 1